MSVNFTVAAGTSVNFLYIRGTFCQLILRPLDFPSTSVNYACIWGTICQHSVRQRDLSSTFRVSAGPSLNFPRICRTFRQPPSTFCASVGHSVNLLCIRGTFHQLSVGTRKFRQLLVNFLCFPVLLCVSIPCSSGTFRPLLSTFHASVGHSIKFPCVFGTFREISVHPRDLPSIFHTAAGPSVNFRKFSMRPRGLP